MHRNLSSYLKCLQLCLAGGLVVSTTSTRCAVPDPGNIYYGVVRTLDGRPVSADSGIEVIMTRRSGTADIIVARSAILEDATSTINYVLRPGGDDGLGARNSTQSVRAQETVQIAVVIAGVKFPLATDPTCFVSSEIIPSFGTRGTVVKVDLVIDDDVDANCIGDSWQRYYFGEEIVDPENDDDLDGVNNYREYLVGTDPINPDSFPGSATLLGQKIFYNNSTFDGNSADPGVADDAAIGTDKQALLPGNVATFENYTGYSRGINGVMIDIENLPGGTLTPADFLFKVGNDNTPSGWLEAPAPQSISVRNGAGMAGSDRVTLIWADRAIQKQWLEVSVLATAQTGIADTYKFYFGNAVGETGNSAADAKVTSADALRVLSNISGSATTTSRYDHNRDGKVGSADRLTVLNNLSSLQPLSLIDLTGIAGGSLAAVNPGTLEVESDAGGFAPNGGSLDWGAFRLNRVVSRGIVGIDRLEDGRFELKVRIPANQEGWVIEKSSELGSGSWSLVQECPSGTSDLNVRVHEESAARYFRVRRR